MAKLEFRADQLPETLQEIARVTSPLTAYRIARRWGGKRLYIPEELTAGHDLVRELGVTAANRLCRHYARDRLDIPKSATYLNWLDTRVLRTLGLTWGEIADAIHVAENRVGYLLRGFDAASVEIDPWLLAQVQNHYRAALRTRVAKSAPRKTSENKQLDFGFPAASSAVIFTGD